MDKPGSNRTHPHAHAGLGVPDLGLSGLTLRRVFTDGNMIRDSQSLLAEYARSGSEPAFEELVARYVGLVHSAAVRLVDGDAHLAQDVTQTVFVDLARMAHKLSKSIMLGGWLHRHTCFVASKMMRGERRRKNRERQAAEMNVPDDHPDRSLITPVLDAAINHSRRTPHSNVKAATRECFTAVPGQVRGGAPEEKELCGHVRPIRQDAKQREELGQNLDFIDDHAPAKGLEACHGVSLESTPVEEVFQVEPMGFLGGTVCDRGAMIAGALSRFLTRRSKIQSRKLKNPTLRLHCR